MFLAGDELRKLALADTELRKERALTNIEAREADNDVFEADKEVRNSEVREADSEVHEVDILQRDREPRCEVREMRVSAISANGVRLIGEVRTTDSAISRRATFWKTVTRCQLPHTIAC